VPRVRRGGGVAMSVDRGRQEVLQAWTLLLLSISLLGNIIMDHVQSERISALERVGIEAQR